MIHSQCHVDDCMCVSRTFSLLSAVKPLSSHPQQSGNLQFNLSHTITFISSRKNQGRVNFCRDVSEFSSLRGLTSIYLSSPKEDFKNTPEQTNNIKPVKYCRYCVHHNQIIQGQRISLRNKKLMTTKISRDLKTSSRSTRQKGIKTVCNMRSNQATFFRLFMTQTATTVKYPKQYLVYRYYWR